MKSRYLKLKGITHFQDGFEFRVILNPQPRSMNIHTHDFNELVFTVNGEGYNKTLKGKNRILRGSIFFIPKNGVHGYDVVKPFEVYNVLFSGDFAKEISKKYLENVFKDKKDFLSVFRQKLHSPVELPPAETVAFERLIEKILKESESKRPGFETLTKTYFAELIINIARFFEHQSGIKMSDMEKDERIERVLALIEKRFADKVTLKELADKVNLVPSYFSAFFRKTTGYSVFEYITEFRIYKACTLLKTTNKPVLETALDCGFNSISLFNRIFKRKTGVSPRKYRQAQKPREA